MKKISILIVLICFLFVFVSVKADLPYLEPKCPNTKTLVNTSITNKDELVQQLNKLIRDAYPDEMYKEWNVMEIEPLHEAPEDYDEIYFEMVKKLCNKEVAKNSWLVELEFPRLLPSASASTGIMFIVKDKERGWYVWYTYR